MVGQVVHVVTVLDGTIVGDRVDPRALQQRNGAKVVRRDRIRVPVRGRVGMQHALYYDFYCTKASQRTSNLHMDKR